MPFCRSIRFCRCLTCSGELNCSTVSKPSRPFALVAIGTLCHAESCSICAHVAPPLEKPQVACPAAFSFLAASNTSGQVFGIAATPAFLSSSLLIHITIDDELKGNDSMSPLEVE